MTQRTRDARYTRTLHVGPFTGRRYVSGGKVRIEWIDLGKRRQRTIGPNTAEARRKADDILQEILASQRDSAAPDADARSSTDTGGGQTLPGVLRALALALLDVADVIADRIERALPPRER